MRLTIALLLALVFPTAAWAHVTVLPESSRPGETVELTFRVPNERDDAATVEVDVFLPPGVPATVEPHDGWTGTASKTGEARWAGGSIAPGRTTDFKVRLGPLPKQQRIVFKSLQHYADGQVVRWIQTSGSDDERPAAVLELAASSGASDSPSTTWFALGAALAVIALTAATLRRRRIM
jgi:uncharacterized protein YcnI